MSRLLMYHGLYACIVFAHQVVMRLLHIYVLLMRLLLNGDCLLDAAKVSRLFQKEAGSKLGAFPLRWTDRIKVRLNKH